jgi:hypothetical protein
MRILSEVPEIIEGLGGYAVRNTTRASNNSFSNLNSGNPKHPGTDNDADLLGTNCSIEIYVLVHIR